jgi:RIO-like serine/threonine protein kinase
MKTKIKRKYTKRKLNKSSNTRNKIMKTIKAAGIRKHSTQNKKKQIGGTILGYGKDGCVVDSIKYDFFSLENGYVAKVFKQHVRNVELQNLLREIDPNEKQFARYYYIPADVPVETFFNQDLQECGRKMYNEIAYNEIAYNNIAYNVMPSYNDIAFVKRLETLNPKTLTRSQYRYLRDSIKILHDNGITHNDLIGNVMIDPIDNKPIIIDWDNAQHFDNQSNDNNDFKLNVEIDNNAFLTHFKVKQ